MCACVCLCLGDTQGARVFVCVGQTEKRGTGSDRTRWTGPYTHRKRTHTHTHTHTTMHCVTFCIAGIISIVYILFFVTYAVSNGDHYKGSPVGGVNFEDQSMCVRVCLLGRRRRERERTGVLHSLHSLTALTVPRYNHASLPLC